MLPKNPSEVSVNKTVQVIDSLNGEQLRQPGSIDEGVAPVGNMNTDESIFVAVFWNIQRMTHKENLKEYQSGIISSHVILMFHCQIYHW